MASTIKVDKIEGSTGSTVTVPTGQTLTVTDGLAIGSIPTITVAKGGTNTTSYTTGDTVYASGATAISKLGIGTARQGLQTNSGASAPEWVDSPQSLMTAAGDVLYASGANTLAKLAKGSDTEVLTLASGVPSWAAAGGGTTVKRHYFPFNTRTAGNASAGVNQFTWTAAFTPIDPTVNDLLVHAIVPSWGGGQNGCGYGTRFTNNSTATNYDSNDNGINYSFSSYANTMSMFFNFPAGTIPAGTYTAYFHTPTSGSQPAYYFPNATDDVRYSGNTLGMLFITEWKN